MWNSPPFYTHPHGYKLCIEVDANGCSEGEGTHISIIIICPFDVRGI